MIRTRAPVMIAAAIALLAGLNFFHTANSDAAQARGSTANAAAPIVVELYQSQGCSSCPPANAALNKIAGRTDVIALSFAVTYWDQLGWKDRFASAAFTQRQRDYAKSLANDGVFTPQIVLNGSRDIVGNGAGELDRAIAAARPLSAGPSISGPSISGPSISGRAISGAANSVDIGTGSGRADVWLVRYDPAERRVPITAGENNGRTLPHRNIVRELRLLGTWTGGAKKYAVPAARESGLNSVILVQRTGVGAIIAARRIG